MYQATSHDHNPPTHTTMLPPRPSRRTKKAKRREVDYRSANRKGTDQKQEAIRELLAAGLPFTVKSIGVALGISRQLALYHVKKMAATGQLVMMLEPCERNGGLQFRVWSEAALVSHFVGRALQRAA
jgi:hypothetical protein